MRRACIAVVSALALTACSLLEPQPDKTRFFVLASSEELGAKPSVDAAPLSVGLGPIELPEYVRRLELVTRKRATELTPSRIDRWSEPLEDAVPRVLGRDLALALGQNAVASYPWYPGSAPKTQVRVTFSRFEAQEGKHVVVLARWEIVDTASREVRKVHESRFEPALEREGGAGIALGLSRALSELSAEIAGALRAAGEKP